MFVGLLDKGNVLHCLSFKEWASTGHVDGQLPRTVEVLTEEHVEDLHVGLLLEENVVGKILQHLSGGVDRNHDETHSHVNLHDIVTYM